MSYKITRVRGKIPAGLKMKFSSYERARQAVRKFLRTQTSKRYMFTDAKATNAAIGDFGFSIQRV